MISDHFCTILFIQEIKADNFDFRLSNELKLSFIKQISCEKNVDFIITH